MKILGIISGIGGVIIIGNFIYWGIRFLKKLKIQEIKIRKDGLKEEAKLKICGRNLCIEPKLAIFSKRAKKKSLC